MNFFGGGDARFRCRNQNVRMRSDSVASYQGTVVQFIGNVRYADSTIEMTADFGTYFRDSEKWEARGNVVLTQPEGRLDPQGAAASTTSARCRASRTRRRCSPTSGPPSRCRSRTRVTGETSEPYVIVGDRIRTRGNDRVYAGGRVTIDRSDFRGRVRFALSRLGHGEQRRADRLRLAQAGRERQLRPGREADRPRPGAARAQLRHRPRLGATQQRRAQAGRRRDRARREHPQGRADPGVGQGGASVRALDRL